MCRKVKIYKPYPQHYMEVSGSLHILAALLLGKQHQYPLHRKIGGMQESVWICSKEKNLCPTTKSNLHFSVFQVVV
jgi:hypothetical protein